MEKTVKGGTMTSEGFIPHLKFMGMELPVVVTTYPDSISPLHCYEGSYIYALPGGERITITQGNEK